MIQSKSMALIVSTALVCGMVSAASAQQNFGPGAPAGYGAPPQPSFPGGSAVGSQPGSDMTGFPTPSTSYATPQSYSPNPPAGGVALVNVVYLFENCQQFQQDMEKLKNELQAVDERFKQQLTTIQQRIQELGTMRAGSPQYKQLEEQIASDRANFDVQRNQARREFLIREGKLYYNTFMRIQAEIQRYALERHLMAVIRFDQDTVDPDNPQEVLRDVNRQVIWYNSTVDITGVILNRINAPQSVGARPGLSLPPR